jgi:predicted NUDIX family NTP pyrophosphohydrolase
MARHSDVSAGLLVFRRAAGLQVLLAHPGGPYWAKRDDGAWTIPKGLMEPGFDLLATAQREFTEETGFVATGEFIPLAPVKQKSGKIVHAWAVEADFDPSGFASNSFSMEWPPRSGQSRSFPEVDRLEWFDLAAGRRKIIAYQLPFLTELEALLAAPADRPRATTKTP